jgi:signal transduction histidine kinase
VTVDASETRPDLPGRFHTEASEPGAIASEVLRTTAALAEVSTISTPKIEASERVYLRVDVTDTGVGLDEEQQQRLFVKWAQAMTPKTERTYGGSGLGLHFSRKLAILLQGQCGLASELGVGSTFSFYVTCRRAPTAIESMPTPVASPLISPSRSTNGPTYRVLLVEDNRAC